MVSTKEPLLRYFHSFNMHGTPSPHGYGAGISNDVLIRREMGEQIFFFLTCNKQKESPKRYKRWYHGSRGEDVVNCVKELERLCRGGT